MHALYWLSVWIHILAAITWVGGILFLVLVAIPWMRSGDRSQAVRFLRATGRRFRNIAWICFAIVAATGTFNLWFRGVRFATFARPEWRASPFGSAVIAKLSVFALVLLVSGLHDFVVGPRAARAMEQSPAAAETSKLRALASRMGRANLLLALALVGIAVALVRGWP